MPQLFFLCTLIDQCPKTYSIKICLARKLHCQRYHCCARMDIGWIKKGSCQLFSLAIFKWIPEKRQGREHVRCYSICFLLFGTNWHHTNSWRDTSWIASNYLSSQALLYKEEGIKVVTGMLSSLHRKRRGGGGCPQCVCHSIYGLWKSIWWKQPNSMQKRMRNSQSLNILKVWFGKLFIVTLLTKPNSNKFSRNYFYSMITRVTCSK